jgi:hypothetical protein
MAKSKKTTGKSKKKLHASAVRPGTANEAAEAYARTAKEIEALPDAQVGRVTTDVPMAVSLALGALPEIESLLPEMSDVFKKPPKAEIERLRDRALALLYANLLWAPRGAKALEVELEEARVLREQLLSAADAHVVHGQMNADSVAAIREGSGHLDRANDLIALAALFEEGWEALSQKTMVTAEQIERASRLGTQLVAELGSKILGTGGAKHRRQLADRRNRAFTLFMRDYAEIQAAVAYVRREEQDAAAFAPPLHRRSRSSATTETETEAGDADTEPGEDVVDAEDAT